MSIKSQTTAYFFAKNITLFEGYTVYGPILSQRWQDLARPTEQLQTSAAGLTRPLTSPR